MKDEAKTRINIDELLESCGFVLQDKAEFNRFAKAQGQDISGVAVREIFRIDIIKFLEFKSL